MYQELSRLLEQGAWRKANEETRLILRREPVWTSASIKGIDAMWLQASRGHFGFSVQRERWKTAGEPEPLSGRSLWESMRDLGDANGWRIDGHWVAWADVGFWGPNMKMPVIPVELSLDKTQAGLLPFYDVVMDGEWKTNFSPRDCWGEWAWSEWARLFKLLKE